MAPVRERCATVQGADAQRRQLNVIFQRRTRARARRTRRPDALWLLLALACATRVAFAGLALAGEAYARAHGAHDPAVGQPSLLAATLLRLADLFCRWDGPLYLNVARDGYDVVHLSWSTAFFPGLPLAIRAVHRTFGLSLRASGQLLGNLADVTGFVALVRLAERRWRTTPASPRKSPGGAAAVAWALCPARVFGMGVATEGLFVATSAGAFLAAERRRAGWAWALAAAAGSVRVQGACVGVGLAAQCAWDAWRAAGARAPSRVGESAAAPPAGWARIKRAVRLGAANTLAYALAGALGPAAYATYLGLRTGDPLAFVHAQGAWQRRPSWPWQTLLSHAELYDHVATWAALAALIALARGVGRVRVGEWTFFALSLALPLCTGRLMSMQRFVGSSFVPFVALAPAPACARLRRPYLAYASVVGALLALKLGLGQKVV